MKSIFGIFYRNNSQFPPKMLEKIPAILNLYKITETEMRVEKETILGQAPPCSLAEVIKTKHKPQSSHDRLIFAAFGRVDNTAEIAKHLDISSTELRLLSDAEVILRAYTKWGCECSSKIYGDWAYAAWHSDCNKLVLSRDHHGNTPIYYYLDQQVFAFSSSRQALLALQLSDVELDELYLAQFITSWFDYHGESTLHKPIKRLPPAHSITVTSDSCKLNRYWFLEDVPELRLSNREEYVDVFLDMFDEAVNCRLRQSDKIASTLSGGLDSSSVAITTAGFLKEKNKRLSAFISIPSNNKQQYQESRFEDELPFAKAVADQAGNIDLITVPSVRCSPISAIRKTIEQHLDPCHGSSNLYWILNLHESVKAMGYDVLLTGAAGNGSISWPGDIFSQPIFNLITHVDRQELTSALYSRLKIFFKQALPIAIVAEIRKNQINDIEWYRRSAIHPDFARRLQLLNLRLHDHRDASSADPREERCRIIMPGRNMGGAYSAELAALNGLTICDPTADARLLALTLSIPDHIYINPKTWQNKWLIRTAMKGRLPDKVRLNQRRGRQAGDLVMRLRAYAEETDIALNELERGPAADYLDVDYMRQIWKMIQLEDTSEAFIKSTAVLTRGIMAGLFVNQFHL